MHRTPLRRVSHGSLFALSRSQQHPDAPHGLGFIEPAIAELVDEADALHANVDSLRRLSHALRTFNESFASWLYAIDMNALTTDWLQAPTDASFQLANKRAEQDARAAAEAALQPRDTSAITDLDKPPCNDTADYETTFATAVTTTSTSTKSAPAPPKAVPKKKGKPKLTAKEKKERMMAIEKIVMSLPLEFRGSDPGLRRNMEMVIESMIDSDGRGIKLIELINPPDLNQARVNKCLIALVNRKIVRKDNASGSVLYHWHGLS